MENVITGQKHKNIRFFLGFVLSAAVVLFVWRVGRYLQRLLRQPLLISQADRNPLSGSETVEMRAHQIAIANLKGGIEARTLPDGSRKLILNAGFRNFREPWARDFSFSSLGLLAIDEHRVVRENLEVFFRFQTERGQFPIKVHSTHVLNRYLHALFKRQQPVDEPIRPRYFSGHRTISLDGNGLLVIAALYYVRRRDDDEFIYRHWASLTRALTWLGSFSNSLDGLLHQEAYSDWADSIARKGRVLYTNVIYWKALRDMAEAASTFMSEQDAAHWEEKASAVYASIQQHFWRADLGYFVTSQAFDNLSSSGNLLAIAWGLATPRQASSILDAMDRFGMSAPVPTRVVHASYPHRYIALENRLVGMGFYHTEASWLWLGAWHVIALVTTGRVDKAHSVYQRMAQVVTRDGEIHEVYAPSGRYVSGFWYTSEAPLTWSAGLFVYATEILRQASLEQQPGSQDHGVSRDAGKSYEWLSGD